jgi:hypothetical protein
MDSPESIPWRLASGAEPFYGKDMARFGAGWRLAGLALGLGAFLIPAVAAADEDRPRPRYQGIDVSALVSHQLLPTNFFGLEAAYAVGNETFQARLGAVVSGGRAFDVGAGRVSNAMQVGQVDLCAARGVLRHRIRMCAGAQAGAMQHRWLDVRPGRKLTPYAAGVLRGDYRFSFTPRVGLLLGVGVSVPFVGPRFLVRDELGRRPGQDIFPGPIAATMTLGASFSFG